MSRIVSDYIAEYRKRLKFLNPPGELDSVIKSVFEKLVGLNSTAVIFHRDRALSGDEELKLNQALDRLVNGEPLHYVLGEAWFLGMRLEVNPHVLIPRPETEELVEWICKDIADPKSILDACTGSGCIAIALKRNFRHASVMATDVSDEALETAARNAVANSMEIKFIRDNMLASSIPVSQKFDLVVSNPPYIGKEEKGNMASSVTHFEPHLALFVPGEDPLIFYQALTDFSSQHLSPQGALFLEINQQHGAAVCDLLERAGFSVTLRKDLSGNDRMVKAVFPR